MAFIVEEKITNENPGYKKLSWLILMSILVIKNKKNIDAYLTLEF